jgi:3-isopropylmalate dehydrogenase
MRICVLPGDGIGPEVTTAALRVLAAASARFGFAVELDERPFGGAAIDAVGHPFPDATREACVGADAVLLGAVGGPSWNSAPVRPEQGLLALRSVLGCYANIRPARRYTRHTTSPLRDDLVAGLDLVIVRELIGGIYFGDRELGDDEAYDTCSYSAFEIRRIVERACIQAERRSGRLTSVDKANVLATSKLWRRVATEVCDGHPEVTLSHQLVDSMAMLLVQQPGAYDVIVTENLFGDVLSDLAAAVSGGIGLAPSASLADGGPGIFEPIHGTAPDIAGLGKANPAGAILSIALLLDELAQPAAARAVEAAVTGVLDDGARTPDLGGTATTDEVANEIADALTLSAPTPTPTSTTS